MTMGFCPWFFLIQGFSLLSFFMFMRIHAYICLIAFVCSCSGAKISNFQFLEGNWKVEGREQFEVWELIDKRELNGYGYTLIKNEKKITETLSLKFFSGNIMYEATVPDQNQGRTVQFTLNKAIDSCWSFENLQHDFPNKIQYKKINEQHLRVLVLGNNGNGFSYTLTKQ